MVATLKRFYYFLAGHKINIATDHKSLEYLLKSSSPPSPRLARWLEFLLNLTFPFNILRVNQTKLMHFHVISLSHCNWQQFPSNYIIKFWETISLKGYKHLMSRIKGFYHLYHIKTIEGQNKQQIQCHNTQKYKTVN